MIKINGQTLELNHFPQGELKLNYIPSDAYLIHWHFESNEEILALKFVMDQINEQQEIAYKRLHMPYIPYARMDRIKQSGETFTLKYFAKLLNSMNFDDVVILDQHSDVSMGLIDRVKDSNSIRDFKIKELYTRLNCDYICYPDNGCAKRLSHLKLPNLVGYKDRDWNTGEIKSLNIIGEFDKENASVLIVDDIVSYGGTFYYTAKALRKLGVDKIYLYVTHCEDSILKGKFPNWNNSEQFDNLLECGLIEKVFTTDSICTIEHEKIEKYELFKKGDY